MTGELAENRAVLRIGGKDAHKFLQDLITNDLNKADKGLMYAALLTPQGKYLFDFFLVKDGDSYLLDVHKNQAAKLFQRLSMYRLRADVEIEGTDFHVNRGLKEKPENAFDDPRSPNLGWRTYGSDIGTKPKIDWTKIRVVNCIPAAEIELISDSTYILEADFERLNGVDFRKGCYVGQEVTARMKHKTTLRKGFAVVEMDGEAGVGTEITNGDKSVGTLFSQSGNQAIAYLRFDRAGDDMKAADATVRYSEPT